MRAPLPPVQVSLHPSRSIDHPAVDSLSVSAVPPRPAATFTFLCATNRIPRAVSLALIDPSIHRCPYPRLRIDYSFPTSPPLFSAFDKLQIASDSRSLCLRRTSRDITSFRSIWSPRKLCDRSVECAYESTAGKCTKGRARFMTSSDLRFAKLN